MKHLRALFLDSTSLSSPALVYSTSDGVCAKFSNSYKLPSELLTSNYLLALCTEPLYTWVRTSWTTRPARPLRLHRAGLGTGALAPAAAAQASPPASPTGTGPARHFRAAIVQLRIVQSSARCEKGLRLAQCSGGPARSCPGFDPSLGHTTASLLGAQCLGSEV